MRKLLLVIPLAALFTLLAHAQQSTSTDVVAALLAEVRQLRIAMERSVTMGPRIELLRTRVAVENERVSRASRDLDGVRQQLDPVAANIASSTARMQDLQEVLSRATDPEQRNVFEQETRDLTRLIEEQTALEQRLRVRETDLANALTVEQSQWTELSRRLDELERQLAASQPR